MKEELERKIKLINTEERFVLLTKLNNAKTKRQLRKVENDIDNALYKMKYLALKERLNELEQEYYLNINLFSDKQRKFIEKKFSKCNSFDQLFSVIPVVSEIITAEIEIKNEKNKYEKFKMELNNREQVLEVLKNFRDALNRALPYMDHLKYLEIMENIEEQEKGIYNIYQLIALKTELDEIYTNGLEEIKRDPEKTKNLFIQKSQNKKA